MKPKRVLSYLLVCLLVLALAGCGESASTKAEKNQSEGNTGQRTQTSLLDPCKIITKSDFCDYPRFGYLPHNI